VETVFFTARKLEKMKEQFLKKAKIFLAGVFFVERD